MTVLRLATLNVWGLPAWVARHGEARMGAIGERLEELRLDVIAFQEVWVDELRDQLVAAGRDAGLVSAWHNPRAFGGSGLLILSRHAFTDTRFHRYTLGGLPQRIQHADYYGGKGLALARIELPEGGVWILDTHLQAQYGTESPDEYRGHRVAQILELSDALLDVTEPVVALGDFNLVENDDQYRILLGASGLSDAAVSLDRRQATTLSDHPYRRGKELTDERIDYVFTRSGQGTVATPRSLERILDETLQFGAEEGSYSDHSGLLAEVEFAADAASTVPALDRVALDLAATSLSRGRDRAQRRRRSERTWAAGGVSLACLGAAGALSRRAGRRRFLREFLGVGAVASLGFGAGMAALSEYFVPTELEGYQSVGALLKRLRDACA